jgi:3-hydroxyacyl-CoA dehydrogenase
MAKIAQCRLDYRGSCGAIWYKKIGFEQIENLEKGNFVTSNTSGIPFTLWVKEEVKISKTLCGTHF